MTFTVNGKVPAAVGVPVMAPPLLKLNPVGSGSDPGARIKLYPEPEPPVPVHVEL
jgi:hypothetical protein